MVGKAKSCTGCRQAKGACDAPKRAPKPCSRCVEKKLECRFDKNFKRIYTRQITREITNGLHNVRPASSSTTPEKIGAPGLLLSDDSFNGPEFAVGNSSVSSDTVVELFRHFERHYRVHAPFLQPIHSLTHLYLNFPLLFWTICLVASQHHPTHGSLYEQLYLPHRELLATISTTAIRTAEEVHALLLLCSWPIPRRRGSLDPGWDYVGIAVNACMRMGFHKPLSEPPGSLDTANSLRPSHHVELEIQNLTWLGCFSIGTEIATFVGLLPPISSYYQLKSVRKATAQLNGALSPAGHASLSVYEALCQFSAALEDAENHAEHLALIQTFDGNLDGIKAMYAASWGPSVDCQLQYAKMNLYTFALTPPAAQSGGGGGVHVNTPSSIANRRIMYAKGMEAALALIQRVKEIRAASEAGDQETAIPLLFYPKYFFENLFFAAVFLFRVLANKSVAGPTHRSMALRAMADAHDIFQLLPNSRDFARAAKWVSAMMERAHAIESAPGPSPFAEITVTNRLGASLLWDTVAQLRPEIVDEIYRDEDYQMGQQSLESPEVRCGQLPLAPDMKIERFRTPRLNVPCLDVSRPAPLIMVTQTQEADTQMFWDTYMQDFTFDSEMKPFM
ncbi:uncharacterized protein JN550_002619 [Neoarthrinium moseri]|uniref:uncharacterized protein n=1 Tax=Neoarthrinium moseri TaxID=1658444 RepID=UPI001FDD416F|nr:uncharacterized protein JN550_002619 [Neoarthrinium moseri]KAI1874040.1 hypothetical protein JN550_002619 [Neoarthrinium moseri]